MLLPAHTASVPPVIAQVGFASVIPVSETMATLSVTPDNDKVLELELIAPDLVHDELTYFPTAMLASTPKISAAK